MPKPKKKIARQASRSKVAKRNKPCPFDGNETVVLSHGPSGGKDFVYVCCTACHACGPRVIYDRNNPRESVELATQKWNERT